MTAPLRAALIDLDGTLLDTAPDIAAAVNRMLARLDRPVLDEDEVRNYVGQGSAKLVRRCLQAVDGPESAFEESLDEFVHAYDEESGRRTRVYPGVPEGLEKLMASGIALACVTNKLHRFTVPLLQRTGLAHFFRTLVCGDTVSRLKPDPLPYVHACKELGVNPQHAVVIGDSANDAVSGRAAGCRVLCLPYGYREGQDIGSIPCDAVVENLAAAADYIDTVNEGAGVVKT